MPLAQHTCRACNKEHPSKQAFIRHARESACAETRIGEEQLGQLQYQYCTTAGCRFLHSRQRGCTRCKERAQNAQAQAQAALEAAAIDAEAALAAELAGQLPADPAAEEGDAAAAGQPPAAPDTQEAAEAHAAAAEEQPFASDTRPSKFVPREAHVAFAEAAIRLIRAVLTAIEGNNAQEIEAAVRALLDCAVT
jgi:hypothetical protein